MGQHTSKAPPTDKSIPVRVIGAGYSRTGTVSLALALEILLKGPVCHSGTAVLMREESFIRSWTSILHPNASQEQINRTLRNLTAGYVATTDNPAILFTEELCEIYPDAVVICSTRDSAEWWESAKDLVKHTTLIWLDTLFIIVPTLRLFPAWRKAMGSRIAKVYQVADPTTLGGPGLLELHESYIRRVVPASRLHFFSVKEGWGPLCKILDCPVPDMEFPRVNDKNSMNEFFTGLVKDALLRWMVLFGGMGLAIGLGVWWRGVL